MINISPSTCFFLIHHLNIYIILFFFDFDYFFLIASHRVTYTQKIQIGPSSSSSSLVSNRN